MLGGWNTHIVAGDGRPIVRKTATTEAGRALLQAEAVRLARARHPGVVELLEADGDRLDLDWAGEETLASARPPLAEAAAILASVATTVADLHALGIVHGRIEGAHVILGPDGRPRLCSFRPTAPGEPEPGPADDVAALGRLVTSILGDGADLEPIPERRWRRDRWSGFHRRSLLTLADQASDPDPARRPTARGLAASIVEAVPDARLGVGRGDGDPVRPGTGHAVGGHRRRDSSGPVPSAIGDVTAAGPAADRSTERPTDDAAGTASITGPREATGGGSPSDAAGTAPARHDDPRWWLPGDRPLEELVALAARPASDRPAPGPPGDASTDPQSEATRAATFLGLRVDADPTTRPEGPADRRPLRMPESPPAVPARWVRPAAAVAAALVTVALIAALRPTDGADAPIATPVVDRPVVTEAAPHPTATSVERPAEPTPPADRSAPTDRGTPCPAAASPAADVDGDGCPEPYAIEGATLTVAGIRYRVGDASDRVALGDWDCDGTATPGLVRPATGEVFLFTTWADEGQPLTHRADAVVPGALAIEAPPSEHPCPGARAVLADGRSEPLTVAERPR